MDVHMHDFPCCRIEMDKIWTYVQKKQRWTS
jgi:hypothetical protein